MDSDCYGTVNNILASHNYNVNTIIGYGRFSNVYEISNLDKKKIFACKYYKISVLNAILPNFINPIELIQNEIKLMKQIEITEVVNLITTITVGSHYLVISEKCNGGNLGGFILRYQSEDKFVPEKIVLVVVKQIVDCLWSLYQMGIYLRSLDLRDILLYNLISNLNSDQDDNYDGDININLPIIKFDASGLDYLYFNDDNKRQLNNEDIQLPNFYLLSDENKEYFSPEILLQYVMNKSIKSEILLENNIWSLGILLLDLCVGVNKLNYEEIYIGSIEKKIRHLFTNLPYSNDLIGLILHCLTINYEKRIDIKSLKQSEIFNNIPSNYNRYLLYRSSILNSSEYSDIHSKIIEENSILKINNTELTELNRKLIVDLELLSSYCLQLSSKDNTTTTTTIEENTTQANHDQIELTTINILLSENNELHHSILRLKTENNEIQSKNELLFNENYDLSAINKELKYENEKLLSQNSQLLSGKEILNREIEIYKVDNEKLKIDPVQLSEEIENLSLINNKLIGENEKLKSMNNSIINQLNIIRPESVQLHSEIKALLDKINELSSENCSVKLNYGNLQKDYEEINKEYSKLIVENKKINMKNDDLISKNESIHNHNSVLLDENAKYKNENHQLTANNNQYKEEIARLESYNNKVLHEYEDLKLSYQEIQSENESIKNINNDIIITTKRIKESTKDTSNQYNDILSQYNELSTTYNDLLSHHNQLTEQNKELKIANNKLNITNNDLDSSNRDLQINILSIRKVNNELVNENSQIKNENNMLKNDNIKHKTENTKLINENSRLNQENNQLTTLNNQLNQDISALNNSSIMLKNDNNELLSENNNLKSLSSTLQSDIDAMKESTDISNRQGNQLINKPLLDQINMLENENIMLNDKTKVMITQINTLNDQIASLTHENSKLTQHKEKLTNDFNEVNNKLNNFLIENNNLKRTSDERSSDLRMSLTQRNRAEIDYKKLTSFLDDFIDKLILDFQRYDSFVSISIDDIYKLSSKYKILNDEYNYTKTDFELFSELKDTNDRKLDYFHLLQFDLKHKPDQYLRCLFNVLSIQKQINTFNLYYCRFGLRGSIILSESLVYLTNLENLFLNKNNIDDDSMKYLSNSLTYLSNLQQLSIKNTYSSSHKYGDVGLTSLITAVQSLGNLHSLFLDRNRFGAEGMQNIHLLRDLVQLNLGGNDNIDDKCIAVLAGNFQYLTNLLYLFIDKTKITNRGLSEVINSVQYLKDLEIIDIHHNPQLNDSYLLQLINKYLPTDHEENDLERHDYS